MKPSEPLRPLPARVVPQPGESLASFIRRTSQAIGYESPRRLLALLASHGPLPPQLQQFQPSRALDHLAVLVRQSAETLLSLTLHCYASALSLARKDQRASSLCDSATVLRYFLPSDAVCSRCLKQGSVSYERLLWSFRPIPVCIEHGNLLFNRCPACRRTLRWDRQDILRCRCGYSLDAADAQAIPTEALALAENLHGALIGNLFGPQGMRPAACFWWADQIATAIAKTPVWQEEFAGRFGLQDCQNGEFVQRLAAAEVLADWPGQLHAFLDSFQQVDKYRTTSTGLGRRFGMLRRKAAWLEDQGHPAPAEALRQYLIDRYDGGHLRRKVCLFHKPKDQERLSQRAWITQTSAAKLLGLRHSAVASLIQQGILTGTMHLAGMNGRSVGVVIRKSVEALRCELNSALNVEATVSRLGIGRGSVLHLIHSGTLRGAVRTAKGWKEFPSSFAELDALAEQLPVGKAKAVGWLSLRQATRRFGPTGLSLIRLLELIRNGEISARMANPEKHLNGIVVAQADLVAQSTAIRDRRDRTSGYPLHSLGKCLFPGRPIKPTVLKKWISVGLLKAGKSRRGHTVSGEELQWFRSCYCLANEACRLLGVGRTTLSRWEREGRVQPVYGKRLTPGAGFSLYRREDLTLLVRHRPPAASRQSQTC